MSLTTPWNLNMRIELNPGEARVIGCLIEKEITTPDQYPLSLAALTTACNQKSSRDPVMNLTEVEVQNLLDDLKKKHLVSDRGGFGSRVTKYQHRFCNSGFGATEFTHQEVGVLCVLLLRGAQTPGELRSRTNRLCEFSDVQETESVLQQLMRREDGPYVRRLEREPGKRESRYAHLFFGEDYVLDEVEPARGTAETQGAEDLTKVQQLERQVEALNEALAILEERVRNLENPEQDPT
ncbi:MAG: DUF480 domain-containing protein [Candidatus Thiodiazotropha sp.]